MRILYLDVDALSPSHLSCYGYLRKTSPTIDAIAGQGVRFTNFYCSDAPCLPSRTAMYSGRFGFQTGVVGHGGSAAQPRVEGKFRDFRGLFETQGLAHQFQRLGMHTAMVSPFGQRHGAHWFYAGFNEIHNTGKGGMESAEEVQPIVDRWLAEHAAGDNWYLHVNYWDAHTPYRVPLEYGNPFADEPIDPWITPQVLAQHIRHTGPHSALDLGMFDSHVNLVMSWNGPDRDAAARVYPRVPDAITDATSLRQWIDGYDVAIHYVDYQIAKIVAALKKAGVYEQTAIVISADHGENQGELGIYGEHGTADQSTCNIPLIVKWPGGNRGKVDGGLHYNLDLAPTYMDLCGGKPQPVWDGQSFAAAIKPGVPSVPPVPAAATRDELVLSQCVHVCQRSVRFGPWLYIRTYHDGFHPFGPEMLFNIAEDPHEQYEVSAQHPDVCREAVARLLAWIDAQMRKLSATAAEPKSDPLWTVIEEGGPYHALHDPARSPLPAYLQRLEKTGRQDGADSLRRRYPAACK
ncbi:MAG TPA: sulfatase [Tepidisphaeraceae bacterium]|jgi:arylsulfatase A-like enzyme|nr:sulfatase [Tepidisphaeraceae bacterium]